VLAQSIYGNDDPLPQGVFAVNVGDVPVTDLSAYVPHDGDANCDGVVNSTDFSAIAAHFGMTGAHWTDGDLNFDGVVNAMDFNILASNFGYSGPVPGVLSGAALGSIVPEPAELSLLALSALMLRRARRSLPTV
jgi:hypothetical protein